jgi:hypothetical protein
VRCVVHWAWQELNSGPGCAWALVKMTSAIGHRSSYGLKQCSYVLSSCQANVHGSCSAACYSGFSQSRLAVRMQRDLLSIGNPCCAFALASSYRLTLARVCSSTAHHLLLLLAVCYSNYLPTMPQPLT